MSRSTTRALRAAMLGGCATLGFAVAMLRPTPAATRAALRTACEHDAASCEALGERLARAPAERQYPEEPGLYLALACEAGRSAACDQAQAWAQPYADYEVFELDAGCMIRGSAFACEEVANALRDEQSETAAPGVPDHAVTLRLARTRMKRALELHLTGCRLGRADSCLGASRVHAAAFGVAWDPRQAREYATRACELGSADACEQAGDQAAGAAAIALYRRACTLRPGAPHAWLKLARAEQAAGAPPAELAASYRAACARLAFDACAQLAPAVRDLAAEPPAIAQAFARWCAAGDPRGCARTAVAR